jgi:peptidoglycan/LPS O-acetylase OafA/YrhL
MTPTEQIDRPTSGTNHLMNVVRITAALLVVFSHVRPLFFVDFSDSPSQDILTQALYAATSLGHPAVIVFFALSGFWVGGSVIRSTALGSFAPGAYAIARLSRLWVVLIPALMLTQILDRIGTAVRPDSDIYRGSTAYHMPFSPGGPINELGFLDTIGNVLFLQRLYVPALGTNGPLWSLASEFWYYLLFPALMVLVIRRSRPWSRVAAAIVAVTAIVILTQATDPAATPVLAQFPAWLLGAALAWQRARVGLLLATFPGIALTALRLATLGAVLICAVLSRDGSIWREYLLALTTTAMLASFIPPLRSATARAVATPFSWSAEWSFSLYATHMPVLALVAALVLPLSSERWAMTPTSFCLLLGVSVVPVGVAVLMYFVAEKHTSRVRAWAFQVIRPSARSPI